MEVAGVPKDVISIDFGIHFSFHSQLTSNLVFSAIILWKPMPTPSITASRHPQAIAEFRAAFNPPLTASAPPVKNPAITMKVRRSATVSVTHSREMIEPTRIVRIFLLPNAFNCAVKCREKTSPDSKVSSQYGCPCLYSGECSYPPLAVRTISKAFDSMPHCSADSLRQ